MEIEVCRYVRTVLNSGSNFGWWIERKNISLEATAIKNINTYVEMWNKNCNIREVIFIIIYNMYLF